MATFKFYIPAINLMGAGCLQEACSPPRKMKNTSG